jgi:hypothetical protein
MPPNPATDVTARPLTTAGRTQWLIDCPRCGGVHRHLDTGARRAPCGARYLIDPTPTERTP